MAATFNCVFSRALDVSRQVNTNGGNCVKCVRSKLAATVFGIKISLGQSSKALKQEGEWKGRTILNVSPSAGKISDMGFV